jgi:hypothetical protein
LILFKIKDKETLVRVEATLIASGTPRAPVSYFLYRAHVKLGLMVAELFIPHFQQNFFVFFASFHVYARANFSLKLFTTNFYHFSNPYFYWLLHFFRKRLQELFYAFVPSLLSTNVDRIYKNNLEEI